MKPIIKWAGGKTQLLEQIKERLPKEFNTYYEPFIGGAAVLLELNPVNAVINDVNPELINLYQQVRDNVELVINYLISLDAARTRTPDSKEFYYKVRSNFNADRGNNTVSQAARFIYLNKHCFNGLYRVNSKGEFNVPFNGKISGQFFNPDHLREVSDRLKSVDIRCGDFEEAVKDAGTNDFAFFDSPYAPITATSFTDYTKDGFSYEDHVRLANLFKELTNRGCYCMLTNHDTDLVRDLYKGYNFTEVDVRRSINRNGDNRKGKEVIITNY